MKALAGAVALSGVLLGVAGSGILGDSRGPESASARPGSAASLAERPAIAALGRLEPRGGVVQLAGPSGPAPVVRELLVAEGDWVAQGELIALLDTYEARAAEVDRLAAELASAEAELARSARLHKRRVLSDVGREDTELQVAAAAAALRRARAEAELLAVRSPLSGEVLDVHTRPGERVHADGIVELGRTDQMVAIAEVYETDVAGVRLGARASVQSPALPAPLEGSVHWIGRKVGKLDVLGADPAAVTDARVVEVEIALDEGTADAALTYLQVEARIAR